MRYQWRLPEPVQSRREGRQDSPGRGPLMRSSGPDSGALPRSAVAGVGQYSDETKSPSKIHDPALLWLGPTLRPLLSGYVGHGKGCGEQGSLPRGFTRFCFAGEAGERAEWKKNAKDGNKGAKNDVRTRESRSPETTNRRRETFLPPSAPRKGAGREQAKSSPNSCFRPCVLVSAAAEPGDAPSLPGTCVGRLHTM